MRRDWVSSRDRGRWIDLVVPVFIGVVIVAVVASIIYGVWFNATHTCVRSHLEDVAAHWETEVTTNGDPASVWRPAYVERVCDAWEKNK